MNSNHTLLIKNMVCDRCIFAVQHIFDNLEIKVVEIKLGEVALNNEPSASELQEITLLLEKLGFEIIETRDNKLVEDIKKYVLEYLNTSSSASKILLSKYITDQLPYDYSYLSDLFSTVEKITIEQFFISKRIEKVKTLINFGQFSFTEIAYQTGYSSVHHLSAQFKKVTQMTPSAYKKSVK